MDVKQLLESSNDFQTQSSYSKKLVKKWEATGLLEGRDMSAPYAKEHMAIMLENQAKRILVEASQTGTGGTFTAGQGEQWAGVALPLVRKVFAEISAKEFLSVQPMSLPTGLVFFLEFKYGTQQPTIGSGANSRFDSDESMYGTTNVKDVDPFGGLYGAGRFGYGTNDLTASAIFQITTASYADVNFNSNLSASVAAGVVRKLTVTGSTTALPSFDTLGVRSFVVTGSGFSEANTFAEFTSYNSVSNQLSFIVSSSAGFTTGSSLTGAVYYSVQPRDNNRGDFEDRESRPLTGSAAIPEINVELRSEEVAAKTKKLKAKWTPEFSQDLNAYQSLDAEAELTSTISEYVSMEIDLELIDMMISAANTTDVWSVVSNRFYNKATGTFTDAAAGAGGYYNTQGQWFQTLGTKIQSVARQIHAKTLRGQANVLMCGPKVSTIIESIPGYAADTDGSKMEYAMGTQKIGQLNSRYKVIVNPYMQENAILMAYKGSQFLETGAAFCPYIPLIMTPLVYDPETFTPRKGLMTRFAKKILRPEFFGKVFVADLNTF